MSVGAAGPSSERQLLGTAAVIYGGGALAVMGVALVDWLSPAPGYSAGGLALLASVSLLVSSGFAVMWRRDLRMPAWAHFVLALAGLAIITVGQIRYTAPPSFGPMLLLLGFLAAYAFLPRTLSIVLMGCTAAAIAIIFWTQDGWDPPIGYWFFVTTVLATVMIVVAQLVERAEVQTRRANAANDELSALNATLEERVTQQVIEVERLGRLRRFLSAPVAEAVLSADSNSILAPHRREIAVMFCDLRGFTAFTKRVEPEEVIEVLDAYYAVAGEQITRFQATLGSFEGDGLMAYLNDPNPCEAPARQIVEMAVAIAGALDELSATWSARGFNLSYGIGMAFGHATLGAVGFDGRSDYTALGTVVNLGARLCSTAGPRELIVDHRIFLENDGTYSLTALEPRQLKGFAETVPLYSVDRPNDAAT